jgi:ABC-type Na+ efflux pump permease subunit
MKFPVLFAAHLNVWPVVQRELREGARRPVNHRLRFGSAGVGTLLLWIIMATFLGPEAQKGVWLFGSLHTFLLVLTALIVPALTADCIAREKRDGTLGLLFMTPLSAGGIVAGKALAQGLRAFTLWLAVLPILAIPFTTGGITWFDAYSALSLEFCATVLCLAAGLLASSLAKGRNAAFLLAFLLALCFLFVFSQLFMVTLIVSWRGFFTVRDATSWQFMLEALSFFCGLPGYRNNGQWNSLGLWNFLGRTSPLLVRKWTWLCLASPLAVLLFFYVAARFAARRIERSWQDKIPSARRESLLRRYCTPLFRGRFRRKMQRTLDWNPIAWLQQYSWKARLSKWSLCLAFVLVEFVSFHAFPERHSALVPLLLALGGIYTFFGVSGFLEEKRSGALELLLITPISVNKLIFGRAWGLWQQFLPAGLILAGDIAGWLLSHHYDSDFFGSALTGFIVLAFGFLALPVFATYSALRVKNLIVATALTWIALIVPEVFAAETIQMFTDFDTVGPVFMVLMDFISYGAFTLLTCFLLRHSLSRRIYAF